MNTPEEVSRTTAPAHSSSHAASQPTETPDSFFFDPPTINNSLLSGEVQERPYLSFYGTEPELNSVQDINPSTGANTSSNESLSRRRQASRRAASTSGTTGVTPRVRSLETVAVAMKSDVEGGGSTSGTASTNNNTSTQPARPSTLTRAALDEHREQSSSSFQDTPPVAHDMLPLLAMSELTAGGTAAAASAGEPTNETMEFFSTSRHPSEEAEGSVHVATRSAGRRGPRAPPTAPLVGTHSTEFDHGIELSMDAVSLQIAERRYLRSHLVSYLDECTLHIAPGSLHCITSTNPAYAQAALAVLAGVVTGSTVKGATLANAMPTSSLRYRRQVAYVSSLDCCTEEATVYDNLSFATRIRFKVDAETLHDAVERAASDAFLMEHLHTRASDLGLARRYLLATAMELVAEPTVLLLENPLAFFALSELQLFMQFLRNMRHTSPARTVVWTATNIPWTLFDGIDSLTLLTVDGKTFYTGSKGTVEAFLQEDLGILRVPGEDVVDILSQTEVDAVAVAHSTTCFRDSKYYRAAQQEVGAHRTRISDNVFASSSVEPLRGAPPYASVQASLLVYTLRRNVLGKAALVPWAGLFAVLVVVCIVVAVAEGEAEQNLQNIAGILFLLLSCAVQVNTIFLKTELRDWRTFLSFRNNLYFPVAPYYVATVVRLLAPRLCFALAGSLCGALLLAQGTAVALSAMMALLSFVHACLGLVALYWVPRLDVLVAATHLYYAYCVIFSGFLVSLSRVPTFLQVLSLIRLAYGGLLAHEMSGTVIGCNETNSTGWSDVAFSSEWSTCFSGDQYLLLVGLQNDSLGMSFLSLSLLALCLLVALGLSMHLSPSARLSSPV